MVTSLQSFQLEINYLLCYVCKLHKIPIYGPFCALSTFETVIQWYTRLLKSIPVPVFQYQLYRRAIRVQSFM
jgi:hypothetical protein